MQHVSVSTFSLVVQMLVQKELIMLLRILLSQDKVEKCYVCKMFFGSIKWLSAQSGYQTCWRSG